MYNEKDNEELDRISDDDIKIMVEVERDEAIDLIADIVSASYNAKRRLGGCLRG